MDQKAVQATTDSLRVYIGTYTKGASRGIYLARLDVESGSLTTPDLVAETVNPSFLAIHPTGRFLYAVSSLADAEPGRSGGVSAFAIDEPSGGLAFLNQEPSGGAGPCHLTVDGEGRSVLVANYRSGSAAVLPVGEDGRLAEPSCIVQHTGSGPNPERQEGPHAHSINLDPSERFAFVADLGLDRVFVYRFAADAGVLTANDPPSAVVAPGAGPRHLAFHPAGRFAYVINEMGSTVTVFSYDAGRGALVEVQTVTTLPPDFTGENWPAEVTVHPTGRFVYGSNRGHDSIAVFRLDADTGLLTPMGHAPTGGREPRHFAIDPTGAFLLAANQDSDSIIVFRIDPATGRLSPTGCSVSAPCPVCIRFMSGR